MGSPAKTAVRDEIRRRLALWSAECRRTASLAVLDALTTRPEWKQAGTVGLFLSLPDEPETRDLIRRAWEEGKKSPCPKPTSGTG